MESDRSLFRDISINTMQVVINQFLGVCIFLLISLYLDKPVYGELSWSLAVLTVVMTILSLRLEQVVVRNTAAGRNPSEMLTLFTAHNLVLGAFFFVGISAGYFLFPVFFGRHPLLWILSISQLLSFISLPFRQLAAGRSAFGWLAVLSTISNLIRVCWLLWLALFSKVTVWQVLFLFIISSLAEFLLSVYIVSGRLHISLSTKWRLPDYGRLIRESLPQLGLVFLNAGIARIDWILLGFFCGAVKTAEYSFAYKVFELSPLPLLILAPLLFNRCSRYFGGRLAARNEDQRIEGQDQLAINDDQCVMNDWKAQPWMVLLIRMEMIFATLLPLLAYMVWSPLVDNLTHHKYGQVNALSFLILSFCIPFQYLVNLVWTVEFARNRLGLIFKITALTGALVLAGDWLLIPKYAGPGAALAYLVAMVVQYLLYCRYSAFVSFRQQGRALVLCVVIAVCSGLAAYRLTDLLSLRLLLATGLYGLLAWVTGQIRANDLSLLREWIPLHHGSAFKRYLGELNEKYFRKINWPLLIFLVLFLNVKFAVKIAAILIVSFLQRKDLASGRGLFRTTWVWFYFTMILLACINILLPLLSSSLSFPRLAAFGWGLLYWLLAIAAAYHSFLFVKKGEPKKLHHTVLVFFVLHIVCVLSSFLAVCITTGALNPYSYRGLHEKYFINTGDFITGISWDNSVTTALISAAGLLYFLYRRRMLLSLLCMVCVLLAGSNLTDCMLAVVFVVIFFFHSSRLQKSMIILYSLMLIIFWAMVSPENKTYAAGLLYKFGGGHDSTHIVNLDPNPGFNDFKERPDVTERKLRVITFWDSLYPGDLQDSFDRKYAGWERPGKWIGILQLGSFFANHPARLLTGTGMGNFSSRLAFKTAALGIGGAYPKKWRWIAPSFRDNYLYIYLYYFRHHQEEHSVANRPDSVYSQLAGEYGLIGLLLFFVLYAGGFLKRLRYLTYGVPLLLLLGGAFFTEYWFEQLSVVVLFEFLLLLDGNKENTGRE